MKPLLLALVMPAQAMEGMWMPEQLPELAAEAKAMGSEIDWDVLANVSDGPLSAIVDLEICSGAFVSPDGLIATAYHCVGDYMQHNSKPGTDLFETGFYAENREDELWGGPSGKVRVTTDMRNVTDQVFSGTKRLVGQPRHEKMQSNMKTLVRRCESRHGTHCEVVPFDHGTQYQLISQLELNDVRVVYVPPRAVGYYGGDDDNWQWPRHSGDFAYIRAYAAPDNKPRSFRKGNVPYKPKQYLKTAKSGPRPGEFVMVPGYPGGTYRWLTATEIEFANDDDYPRRIAMDRDVLGLLEAFGEEFPDEASKVSTRILGLNNRMQYLEGNLKAFKRIDAVERKRQFEDDLHKWIQGDSTRSASWSGVLDKIHALQGETAGAAAREHLAREWQRQVLLFRAANTLYKLSLENQKRDAVREPGYQNRDRPRIREQLIGLDARYDFRIDQQIMWYFLDRALAANPGEGIPELEAWFAALPHEGTREEKIQKELRRLYVESTILTDPDRRIAMMDSPPWYLEKNGGPWFALAAALRPWFERLDDAQNEREGRWTEVRADYTAAIKQFIPLARPRAVEGSDEGAQVSPGLFYPDANSTLRVTIGRVDGYFPRDGLIASPRTRLVGVEEKAGPEPFDAPPALRAAIEGGKYGPYADDALGSVSVNYLSTADTTLGSSGSATMNAQGEWIGVLFDGNYESMATDWVFEEALTRSIHTDSSYVLWYLDAVAGADGLLEELGIEPALDTVGAETAAKEAEPSEPKEAAEPKEAEPKEAAAPKEAAPKEAAPKKAAEPAKAKEAGN